MNKVLYNNRFNYYQNKFNKFFNPTIKEYRKLRNLKKPKAKHTQNWKDKFYNYLEKILFLSIVLIILKQISKNYQFPKYSQTTIITIGRTSLFVLIRSFISSKKN